jgi:phosphoribosylformylglycinamidine synthase
LAKRKLLRSARDISDGGIAVALAQAGFPNGIGATVEQDSSLMVHPLFGLFAEPASTVFVTAHPDNIEKIETLAGEYSFFVARIGTTGGTRLEITVDGEPFISAPLADLRKPWASALEATLHGEVMA